jgi:hypothetical protein
MIGVVEGAPLLTDLVVGARPRAVAAVDVVGELVGERGVEFEHGRAKHLGFLENRKILLIFYFFKIILWSKNLDTKIQIFVNFFL